MKKLNYTSNNKGNLFILFLISPLLALIYSVNNFSKKEFHIIILMFAFLYGYTFLIIENSDTERYIEVYKYVNSLSFDEIIFQLQNVYSGSSGFTDFYVIILSVICSFFGAGFKVFLGVHSVIYFFLLIKTIDVIFTKIADYNYKKYIIYFIGLIFIYSFSKGIIGIRFQTGYLVFFLFVLKYVFSKKSKFVLLAGLSCFVHIGLSPVYLGFVLFYFLQYLKSFRLKLIAVLIFMFVLSSLSIVEISQGMGSETIDSKMDTYTNSNYIDNRENHVKKWNWYIQLNQFSRYYFLMVALFLTRLKIFKLKKNRIINDLFLLAIIFLTISVFYSMILDSISNRYRNFFQFMGLLYLFFLFSFNRVTFLSETLKNSFLIILILNVLIGLRVDSYTFDVIRLTLSPILLLFGIEGANIYNII